MEKAPPVPPSGIVPMASPLHPEAGTPHAPRQGCACGGHAWCRYRRSVERRLPFRRSAVRRLRSQAVGPCGCYSHAAPCVSPGHAAPCGRHCHAAPCGRHCHATPCGRHCHAAPCGCHYHAPLHRPATEGRSCRATSPLLRSLRRRKTMALNLTRGRRKKGERIRTER